MLKIISGIEKVYRIEKELSAMLRKPFLSFMESRAFILGSITLVNAVKKASTIEYSLNAVV